MTFRQEISSIFRFPRALIISLSVLFWSIWRTLKRHWNNFARSSKKVGQ